MKRKNFIWIVLITIILLLTVSLTACEEEGQTFVVSYNVISGGTIEGKTTQFIQEGKDAETVLAVPNKGYMFYQWSDGYKNAERTDKNILGRLNVTAEFRRIKFEVIYESEKGGYIEGNLNQSVNEGEKASSVTAIADEHYKFIGWSDGFTEPTRNDENITSNLKVRARFERISAELKYNYKNATGNNETESILLSKGQLSNKCLAVPEKEYFYFSGWYLDSDYQTCVADKDGNITIGDELFDYDEFEIYAKWTVIDKISYNILLVYNTEFKANLTTYDGTNIPVHYKMTELDRRMCKALTYQFLKFLNEITEGLVSFKVDEYFTTVPIGIENTNVSIVSKNGQWFNEYFVDANLIQEIAGMVNNYRSVINIFSFGDNEPLFRNSSGHGGEKFASIYYNCLFEQAEFDGYTLDELLANLNNHEWDSIVDTFLHEFTHTVEQGISTYRLHNVMANYHNQGIVNEIEIIKDYLLNQAHVTNYDESVGIPYCFWKNEIFTMKYLESKGGYVDSSWPENWQSVDPNSQRIPKGSRGSRVIAEPMLGYRFSHWSDGVTTETRVDYNIQSDMTITAIFEPLAYEVRYNAGEGGRIDGQAIQSVLCDSYSQYVTAVANEGYRFIGWSDGYEEARRRDEVRWNRLGLQVTALFEKIS